MNYHRKVGRGANGEERIRRQAELLTAARLPGVVEVVGVEGSADRPVLVTALVDGPTLAAPMPLTLEEVAGLVADVAATLAELHEMGIVHGAVVPEHVLVGPDGRPVLCGFGSAGRVGDADPAGDDELHPAADVAGLGRILRRLATGPDARALRRVAEAATAVDPAARPSARAMAGDLTAAVPGARLPVPGPAGTHGRAAMHDLRSLVADARPDRRRLSFRKRPSPTLRDSARPHGLGGVGGEGELGVHERQWSLGGVGDAPGGGGPSGGSKWGAPGRDGDGERGLGADGGGERGEGERGLGADGGGERGEGERGDGERGVGRGDGERGDGERGVGRGDGERGVGLGADGVGEKGLDDGGAARGFAGRISGGGESGEPGGRISGTTPDARRPLRPSARGSRRLPVRAGALAGAVGAVVAVGLLLLAPWASAGRSTPQPGRAAAAPPSSRPAPTSTAVVPPATTIPARAGCPAPTAVLVADIDGDGCLDALDYADGVLEAAGVRWALGQAGDQVAIGDWSCRGTRTIVLLRPSTGEVFRFEAWALGVDAPVTAPALATVPGGTNVRAADVDRDGCHELVVERGELPPQVVRLPRARP